MATQYGVLPTVSTVPIPIVSLSCVSFAMELSCVSLTILCDMVGVIIFMISHKTKNSNNINFIFISILVLIHIFIYIFHLSETQRRLHILCGILFFEMRHKSLRKIQDGKRKIEKGTKREEREEGKQQKKLNKLFNLISIKSVGTTFDCASFLKMGGKIFFDRNNNNNNK